MVKSLNENNSSFLPSKSFFKRDSSKIKSPQQTYDELCSLADEITRIFNPQYLNENIFFQHKGIDLIATFVEDIGGSSTGNTFDKLTYRAKKNLNLNKNISRTYPNAFSPEFMTSYYYPKVESISLNELSKEEIFNSFQDLDNFDHDLFNSIDSSLLKKYTCSLTASFADSRYYSKAVIKDTLEELHVPKAISPLMTEFYASALKLVGWKNVVGGINEVKKIITPLSGNSDFQVADDYIFRTFGTLHMYNNKLFQTIDELKPNDYGIDDTHLIDAKLLWGTILGYDEYSKSKSIISTVFHPIGFKIFNFDDSKKLISSLDTTYLSNND